MKAVGLGEVWLGRNVGVILCLCESVLELSGCQELVLEWQVLVPVVSSGYNCIGCYEAIYKNVQNTDLLENKRTFRFRFICRCQFRSKIRIIYNISVTRVSAKKLCPSN